MSVLGLLMALFSPLVVKSCSKEDFNFLYQCEGCGLTQVPTDIPASAAKINLKNNNISDIPPAVFSHLTECTILWLEYNTLTHIEATYFVGLQSLEQLYLIGNLISEIKPGAFILLEHCTTLWMDENKLTQIKVDMFKGLRSLEILSLCSNGVADISTGAFKDIR